MKRFRNGCLYSYLDPSKYIFETTPTAHGVNMLMRPVISTDEIYYELIGTSRISNRAVFLDINKKEMQAYELDKLRYFKEIDTTSLPVPEEVEA